MGSSSQRHAAAPVAGIETARFAAVMLLLLYHVVGSGPEAGLRLHDTHPVRLMNDFLADLRMPLFACIAGFVYALKPVTRDNLRPFLTGKFRRLAIPGAVATICFLLWSEIIGTPFAMGDEWWKALIMPYAHFWFLQAILVIFVFYCGFDILTNGRWLEVSLILASGWYLAGIHIPVWIMSFNQALYLLPYFILGILLCRRAEQIKQARTLLLLAALLVMVAAIVANVQILQESGRFSTDRRDLQSLAFGSSVAALCLFTLSHARWLTGFGAFSITIYLYHVFGTSLARRSLEFVGIGTENLWIHVPAGVLMGFACPWVVHHIASSHAVGQHLILGQRPHRLALT